MHHKYRRLAKNNGGFPNDDRLLKLLFMDAQNASKKCATPIQNWNYTVSQLSIFFDSRIEPAINS